MTLDNSPDSVILKIEGRIATIELNRPKVLNALNVEMLRRLLARLKEATNSDADILLIYGNGNGFSAGGDIRAMINEIDEAGFYPVMDVINEMMVTLYTMPKLVISAVHGAAAGLGFSLALATDYIMAEEPTAFAMNFIQIGLIPDGGSHFFLNKRLGEAKAKQLIWQGKNNTAKETLELGLIDEIVSEDVITAARIKAEGWLERPILSMLQTKKILTDNSKEELIRILEMEKEGQAKMRKSADHLEGMHAFVEKRKPNFTGK